MSLIKKLRQRIARQALSPIARAVLRQRLTYLSVEKFQRIERALKETRSVPGDIVEFGVALGGSAIVLAHGAGVQKRFFGLDVFSMIPPPTSDKDDEKSKKRYEVIRTGQSSGIGGDQYYGYREDLFSDVKDAFQRNGVPVDAQKIVLLKGLFEETWPTVEVERVSLVHIDCDWHDPVAFGLRETADKLSTGGMIILDDYHTFGGCKIAVDAFLQERSDFEFEDGQNPILRKTR